jgi:hypothetical protein
MSKWLDLSNSANKLAQTYVRGFIDISGGGMSIRNDQSLDFYHEVGDMQPIFTIQSSSLSIADNTGIFHTISPQQFIHLTDLSDNVQNQFNTVFTKTAHIESDASYNNTMLFLDGSNNRTITYNDIVPLTSFQSNLGTTSLPFNEIHTNHLFSLGDSSFNNNVFINGNLSVTGNIVGTYLSVISSGDVSTNRLFVTSDTSFNERLFVGSDVSFGGNLFVSKLVTANNGLTVANGTVSLPSQSVTDTALSTNVDLLNSSQTITGTKTFSTSPVIGNIINIGTLTLPTSTDTLVGQSTTDTFVNKSMSGSSNTFTDIPNNALTNSNITLGTSMLSLGNTLSSINGLTSLSTSSLVSTGDISTQRLFVTGDMNAGGNIIITGTTFMNTSSVYAGVIFQF